MYLIGEFRRKCKEKFEAGELSSSDFEIGMLASWQHIVYILPP